MIIGLLTLDLHFPGARSLKDKRQALRSLETKLRNRFNVAVAGGAAFAHFQPGGSVTWRCKTSPSCAGRRGNANWYSIPPPVVGARR